MRGTHQPSFAGFGRHVIDGDGCRYLDFSSQLVFTTRRQRAHIVAAINQQADQLCTLASGPASDVRGKAARMIVEVAPYECRSSSKHRHSVKVTRTTVAAVPHIAHCASPLLALPTPVLKRVPMQRAARGRALGASELRPTRARAVRPTT